MLQHGRPESLMIRPSLISAPRLIQKVRFFSFIVSKEDETGLDYCLFSKRSLAF